MSAPGDVAAERAVEPVGRAAAGSAVRESLIEQGLLVPSRGCFEPRWLASQPFLPLEGPYATTQRTTTGYDIDRVLFARTGVFGEGSAEPR